MGEHLVYLRDSFSLLEVPAAVEILRQHGMRPVKTVDPHARGDVVAVITGLGRFTANDAVDFPGLRTVARFGAGYDNIDVRGLWETGRVSVSYTPDVSSSEVAEFALAMIILTLRGVPRDVAGLTAEPSQWRPIGRGMSLSDATVGIVGCGNIGTATARLVAPLASRVLLWNRSKRVGSPAGEVVSDLDTLAAQADVISVHVSLTDGSQKLIGAPFFEKVRSLGRSIALVNTARGNAVDEEALLEALQAHVVRAAAIDVWSVEGKSSTLDFDAVAAVEDRARLRTLSLLRHHPSVLPTSHIGAFTGGVLHRCAMQCAYNIVSVIAGEQPGHSSYIATPAQ